MVHNVTRKVVYAPQGETSCEAVPPFLKITFVEENSCSIVFPRCKQDRAIVITTDVLVYGTITPRVVRDGALSGAGLTARRSKWRSQIRGGGRAPSAWGHGSRGSEWRPANSEVAAARRRLFLWWRQRRGSSSAPGHGQGKRNELRSREGRKRDRERRGAGAPVGRRARGHRDGRRRLAAELHGPRGGRTGAPRLSSSRRQARHEGVDPAAPAWIQWWRMGSRRASMRKFWRLDAGMMAAVLSSMVAVPLLLF